ncbi:MAG: selenium-dependent xanthine dehydrogenase [Bacteroidetes bacterium HGW-Bacteroidetes-6]|jgi:selenium-dependent xanthine dehydrogenase|nr:MAG: selenium-dependent xanthine dehydrogenase [Bacteroidetes bacterium HGW-Bacteroidetes-6]
MVTFSLNNNKTEFGGNTELSLLNYLRNDQYITSVKDGCNGQSACGACLVEIDGKAKLSCVTKMGSLEGASVLTLEGIPDKTRDLIAKAFVAKGAVQCGFCTPGFVMRTKILLQENPDPDIDDIRTALKWHLCRCTGYKKIEKAIELSSELMLEHKCCEPDSHNKGVGDFMPKYEAFETAIGQRKFVNDLSFPEMMHAALRFSDHPRAKVLSIDTSEAEKSQGVVRVFTANDIPGDRIVGLIYKDWPAMIAEKETTHYIGDVIASVVADTSENARKAAKLIKIDYEVLTPVTDMHEALHSDSAQVHEHHINLLDNCNLKQGNADDVILNSKYSYHNIFNTQRIEHAFLETESAVALPDGDGILLYSSGQGIYEDRRQVATMLNLPEEKVRVVLVPNGGGFGGKEDMTVQGHASLFAFLLKKPVKLTLTREESMLMHPKRHPVWMDMTLACDENGKLTAMKLRAVGDTGAYASVGTKVMERIAGHATGGYFVPVIDLESKTVYTNNVPCGAMRGFGANQVAFALEACVDELCKMGNFDRWQFRWDNALVDGLTTATGDHVEGVGIRACLEALKPYYENAGYSGIATAIKNSGIGNGMVDYSDVIIEVKSPDKVILHHGWTEMGQGVHTIAAQILCEETGIDSAIVEVVVDTAAGIKTGMTTSSRGTVLLGNAIREAAETMRADMNGKTINDIVGHRYQARWECNWTVKPGTVCENSKTHYGYGYAAQLVVLDEYGKIEKVVAAHDAGKIINPVMFEGQIEGAVHMGLGYALSEDYPYKNGFPVYQKVRELGVLRAHETPDIEVIGVEVPDSVGPFGAKGVGEIGLVPTAAAVANAFCQFDGNRRLELPMKADFKKLVK